MMIDALTANKNAVQANTNAYNDACNAVMNIIVPAVADGSLLGKFAVTHDLYEIFRTNYKLREKVMDDVIAMLKNKGYTVNTTSSVHSASYCLTVAWSDVDGHL